MLLTAHHLPNAACKAGYEWAQQNGVIDESVGSGNSTSFVEGCQTYVKEPDRGADEDDSGDPID